MTLFTSGPPYCDLFEEGTLFQDFSLSTKACKDPDLELDMEVCSNQAHAGQKFDRFTMYRFVVGHKHPFLNNKDIIFLTQKKFVTMK